jgi:hypothetical protein
VGKVEVTSQFLTRVAGHCAGGSPGKRVRYRKAPVLDEILSRLELPPGIGVGYLGREKTNEETKRQSAEYRTEPPRRDRGPTVSSQALKIPDRPELLTGRRRTERRSWAWRNQQGRYHQNEEKQYRQQIRIDHACPLPSAARVRCMNDQRGTGAKRRA